MLGVNSFGSVSDGNDAEFGFAVSWREVASFLRQAGVSTLRTVVPCRSMADAIAAEAALTQRETQQIEQSERARTDAREAALQKARDSAEQDVISSRENAMAGAAVLLAIAVLGLGAGGLSYSQGRERRATWLLAGGGVLLLGAFALFFLKPSFSSIDERVKLPEDNRVAGNSAYAWEGDNVCTVDLNRSRLTISEANDIPFNWTATGCVNGNRQYVSSGNDWERATVPESGNFITVSRFDPARGMLRVERWLPDSDTMDKARALLNDGPTKACGTDSDLLAQIAALRSNLAALLPAQPNERLVYRCRKGRLAPPDPSN